MFDSRAMVVSLFVLVSVGLRSVVEVVGVVLLNVVYVVHDMGIRSYKRFARLNLQPTFDLKHRNTFSAINCSTKFSIDVLKKQSIVSVKGILNISLLFSQPSRIFSSKSYDVRQTLES